VLQVDDVISRAQRLPSAPGRDGPCQRRGRRIEERASGRGGRRRTDADAVSDEEDLPLLQKCNATFATWFLVVALYSQHS
jgi:hypothetical protein